MHIEKEFYQFLYDGITKNINNAYADNSFELYRYNSNKHKIEDSEYLNLHPSEDLDLCCKMNKNKIAQHIKYKSFLFSILKDDKSRDVLLLDALYDILGHRRIRFPYFSTDHFEKKSLIRSKKLSQNSDAIEKLEKNAFPPEIDLYDCSSFGIPMKMYAYLEAVYMLCYKPAYIYANSDVRIAVQSDDIVFDCGSCFGDYALFFAYLAGDAGQVVALEPDQANYNVLLENIRLNPELGGRILPLMRGTYAVTGLLPFHRGGTGSHVATNTAGATRVPVARIDDVLRSLGLERVDFIKMDVEGAELASLQGAEQVLRNYRPRLAISVYHKPEDYDVIPRYLASLNLNYSFYLDHHSPNQWESVLYAITDSGS